MRVEFNQFCMSIEIDQRQTLLGNLPQGSGGTCSPELPYMTLNPNCKNPSSAAWLVKKNDNMKQLKGLTLNLLERILDHTLRFVLDCVGLWTCHTHAAKSILKQNSFIFIPSTFVCNKLETLKTQGPGSVYYLQT